MRETGTGNYVRHVITFKEDRKERFFHPLAPLLIYKTFEKFFAQERTTSVMNICVRGNTLLEILHGRLLR